MNLPTLTQPLFQHSRSLLITAAFCLLLAPGAHAETQHAAERSGLRSGPSLVEASLNFINRSGQTLKVYWLDSSGKRVLYKTLKPQQGYTQLTFLTHPWLITDADDNAWYLYYADAQPRTVEIIEPALK